MTQLDMFSPPNRTPKQREVVRKRVARLFPPTLEQQFEAFVEANPHVMPEMLRLARARIDRGEKRVGAKALWEELRGSIRAQKLGDWKLNNSFTALAARRLIELEPKLASVIETRKRKTP